MVCCLIQIYPMYVATHFKVNSLAKPSYHIHYTMDCRSNLIGYSLSQHSISHNLNLVHFVLLSLCTMLVAAAGYIINDIKDVKIDLINKPHKVIVGKDLTSQFCSSLYYLTLGIGLLITIYLGWSLDKVPYILLFPIFTGLLHIYATHLKKSLLLGNFLILSLIHI